MKRMTKHQAEKIYQLVAVKNYTTVYEVKKEIELAILSGMQSQDPDVQKRWDEIPHEGEIPTPEELLVYLSLTVKNNN